VGLSRCKLAGCQQLSHSLPQHCMRLRPSHSTPPRLLQSDAEFILLVEKEAAFMRIAEDRFYNTYPCIVITAKGQPDVATR
jgi:DNA topoisomerase VI subunit A